MLTVTLRTGYFGRKGQKLIKATKRTREDVLNQNF